MTGENLGENIRNLTDILKGIRDELENLKNNSNNINTMLEKANDLLKKAKDAESKLKAEIDKVKSTDLVDESIKLAKERAEELLKIDITKEIQNLLNSIKTTITDQNIFSKTKNRIGEQWNAVLDSNKWGWNKEGGKNALRTTGFLVTGAGGLGLAGYLAYQGGKKVYNGIKRRWKQKFGDPLEDTKVKNEIEIPTEGKDVEAKDLIDGLPRDATVEFGKGSGVDITKEGEQEVILVVKLGDKEKKILATIEIKDGKITIKDKKDSKDNKEERKDKKDKDKKPFWDRWYGKALKYSIIGTPIYYVVHGITTGRWSLEDFFNRGNNKPDATSTSEDQVTGVENLKEKDPEKFEKYKGLGDNVDNQFNHFMDKEIKTGWGGVSIADGYEKYVDKSKLSLEDFKAVVPLCIDNQFDNIGKFMSEAGYYDYLRDKDIVEFKSIITKENGNGNSIFLSSLGTFLNGLKSFQQYKGNNIGESIKSWLDGGSPTERIEELQLFFRQYAKVLNYIQDKRYQLRKKIATRIFELDRDGNGVTAKFSTVDDALKDENWVKENIETNSNYINFMQGKLSNAIDVMKAENIFDDKQSETMEQIKIEKDLERANILNEINGEDALSRLDKNKNNMNDEQYKEGKETAGKVYNDIEENFDKDWWYLHCSATYTLFNMDDKNKFEFMEESGLDTMKTNIKTVITQYQNKFKDKTITGKEIEEYNKLINGYFAMKKEIYLASEVIQSMKCNDGDRLPRLSATASALIGDFMTLTKDSWKDLTGGHEFIGWLEATIPLYALGSAVSAAGGVMEEGTMKKIFKTGGRRIKNMTIIGVAPNLLRRTNHISMMPDLLLKLRYDIPNGDSLLLQDVIEGNISSKQARRLVTSKNIKWKHSRKSYNSLEEFITDISGITDSTTLSGQDIARLFSIESEIIEGGTSTKYGISLGKNPKLRKCIFGEPEIEITQYIKRPINGYRKKTYNLGKVKSNLQKLGWDKFFLGDANTPAIFGSLTGKQKYLVGKLLEIGKFKNQSEIDAFIKMVSDNYQSSLDIENLSLKDIKKLLKELGNNASELGDINKVIGKINRLKPLNIAPNRINQPIFGEIDNTKKELDELLKKERNTSKRTQLQQQLDQLEDFKREMGSLPDDEFKKMNSLVECFKTNGNKKTLNEVITEVTKLKKIMDIDGGSLTTAGSGNLKVIESIDDILKDVDNVALKLRKAKNFHPEIANELEDIAKIFEQIKLKNTTKVLGSADDILKGIKILVKLARAA